MPRGYMEVDWVWAGIVYKLTIIVLVKNIYLIDIKIVNIFLYLYI